MALRIGLALSGGGSKGAFTVGALKAVRKHFGVESFPIVSGTSTGSLVGTMAAIERWKEVEHVYSHSITEDIVKIHYGWFGKLCGPKGVFFASAVFGGNSIYSPAPLRATIAKNVDFAEVMSAFPKSLLILNTVDMNVGEAAVFTNRPAIPGDLPKEETLAAALLASADMPVFTDLVEIKTKNTCNWHADGGVREFLPLSAVFQNASDAKDDPRNLDGIVAVATSPIPALAMMGCGFTNIMDVLERTIDLMNTEIGSNDYYGSLQFNSLLQILDNARTAFGPGHGEAEVERLLLEGVPKEFTDRVKGKRHIPVLLISPKEHLKMDSLTFDPETMQEAMRLGVQAGEDAVKNVTWPVQNKVRPAGIALNTA